MTTKKSTVKKIGILTSGGDAPGMNACIRAIVRTAQYNNLEVMGIMRGYSGMMEGDFMEMGPRSVSNIIHRGGTILKSARSKEFRTKEGMEKAYKALKAANIDAVIVIGGDGTFRGANEFSNLFDIQMVGAPGTIDNDLFGTDFTIGYDTGINTALDAIDKIRDTAHSHNRLFFIEVMGGDAGFLALWSGIGGGAEAILLPEFDTSIDGLIDSLKGGYERQKSSSIVVVAEKGGAGRAIHIANVVKDRLDQYEIRVTILGHIQRGGTPTCSDRVLASQLGYESVMALLSGENRVMVGIVNKELKLTPFEEAKKHHVKADKNLLELARVLSF